MPLAIDLKPILELTFPSLMVTYDPETFIVGVHSMGDKESVAEMLRGASYIADAEIGHTGEVIGQLAYEAYGQARGWRTHGGDTMPLWADQEQGIRDAWIAAGTAAKQACHCHKDPIAHTFTKEGKPERSHVCSECGSESFNPNDVANRWCGRCEHYCDRDHGVTDATE